MISDTMTSKLPCMVYRKNWYKFTCPAEYNVQQDIFLLKNLVKKVYFNEWQRVGEDNTIICSVIPDLIGYDREKNCEAGGELLQS